MTASIDLERAVIGAVLLRPDNLAILPTLEIPHFATYQAKQAWSAIRNLESKNQPIDLVTVADEILRMRADHRDDRTQGDRDSFNSEVSAYLGECALTVPTTENAIEYARRIKDYALRRRLMETLAELLDEAKQSDTTGAELLTIALGGLSHLDAEQPEQTSLIGDVIKRRMQQLDEIARERALGLRSLSGYPTGVAKLDEKIGGWQAGIVSIVAARPGMGKSSLGLSTAEACSGHGFGVHVFSLEDTEQAYADRTMSRASGVPAESIRNCELNQLQMREMQSRIPLVAKRKNWLFDDRSGISAKEIVRSVRRHRKENGTKLVIVDYVQLIAKPDRRQSAHEALSEIITTFADAAKQDKLAYVVMSQLNREIEKREDKRPMLADLRESGSLEERAKCVVGVYRGAAYGKQPKKGIDYAKDQSPPNEFDFERTVQLLVLKNSNGRTGTVRAQWDGPTTRME